MWVSLLIHLFCYLPVLTSHSASAGCECCHLYCPICYLLIFLLLLIRMWVLPFVHPSSCLLTSLLLPLLARLWVPSLVHLFHRPYSVSTFQRVSAAPCFSCLLPGDLSLGLSLLIRMWVLPSFVLLTACWPLSLISACQGVSATVCLSCMWQLTLISTWQFVSAVPHLFCSLSPNLLYSLACEYYPLFVLFTACWLSAFQDVCTI